MSAWKPKFCQWCGKAIKRPGGGKDAKKYCGKPCYFAARANGKQAWDKTNLRKARWHKGGRYKSAPSVRLMRRIVKAHLSVLRVAGGLERQAGKELNRPTCEQCGQPCNDGASRFCSYACNKAWRGARACRCGAIVENASAFGNAPMCLACKRQARKARRRIAKDTRKRVRNGGGYWNSEVKALGVFKRDRWRCYLCKCKCSKRYDPLDPRSATVDHVYPVAHGGDHDWHNVRTACALCNAKKSDTITGQMQLVFE